MKVICAPTNYNFTNAGPYDLNIVLYGSEDHPETVSVGATLFNTIRRKNLQPPSRAWDLLSIALSAIAADICCKRSISPDGWTRQLELHVAVNDQVFWLSQKELLEMQLRFLTTDIWHLNFLEGGMLPPLKKNVITPEEDCIVLLSGGLDSLVGALDLVFSAEKRPYAVSQVSQGDKERQSFFAMKIGDGLRHLQLNHNVRCPNDIERSQRVRSLIFLAYGVLAATTLKRYRDGDSVKLYVCENGFISVNPPLTESRLGSLSTRTTHPVFIKFFQQLLSDAGLGVQIINPYQFKTKGEMLAECSEQVFLRKYAHVSTSCSRFARNGYKHCGRCLPCLIRRAAFKAWDVPDKTTYVYTDLSQNDDNHARFDDVRSAAMAIAQVENEGLDTLIGTSLNTAQLGDVSPYKEVLRRGFNELGSLLNASGVQ